MRKYIIINLLFILGSLQIAQAQSRIGIVLDSLGHAIPDISISDKTTGRMMISDKYGQFVLSLGHGVIELKHVGYLAKTIMVKVGQDTIKVFMKSNSHTLRTIDVFSTGYSSIPKERATGSFTELNRDIIGKGITSNILENIEGLAAGLQFDRRNGGENINIRGINTLSLEMMGPLIIVNNFPFSGDINSLDLLDIESVMLLKDAAAASISGARAGNGVIVITTKKGKSLFSLLNEEIWAPSREVEITPSVLRTSPPEMEREMQNYRRWV